MQWLSVRKQTMSWQTRAFFSRLRSDLGRDDCNKLSELWTVHQQISAFFILFIVSSCRSHEQHLFVSLAGFFGAGVICAIGVLYLTFHRRMVDVYRVRPPVAEWASAAEETSKKQKERKKESKRACYSFRLPFPLAGYLLLFFFCSFGLTSSRGVLANTKGKKRRSWEATTTMNPPGVAGCQLATYWGCPIYKSGRPHRTAQGLFAFSIRIREGKILPFIASRACLPISKPIYCRQILFRGTIQSSLYRITCTSSAAHTNNMKQMSIEYRDLLIRKKETCSFFFR